MLAAQRIRPMSVIPAKAGIQSDDKSTKNYWIPAFARMTNGLFLALLRCVDTLLWDASMRLPAVLHGFERALHFDARAFGNCFPIFGVHIFSRLPST